MGVPGLAAAGAARLPRPGVLDRGNAEVEAEMRMPEGALVAGTVRASDESSIAGGTPDGGYRELRKQTRIGPRASTQVTHAPELKLPKCEGASQRDAAQEKHLALC